MKLNLLRFIILCTVIFSACNDSSRVEEKKVEKKKEQQKDTTRIKIVNGTFLGNEHRNFYGSNPPDNLNIVWQKYLGKGQTIVSSKIGKREWAGAGWTGQPLLIEQDTTLFLLQGAYDHHLKKLNAQTGDTIWQYKFDDIIKGTATIWFNKYTKDKKNLFVILQGSRLGINKNFYDKVIPSYRAISFFTGNELWRLSSSRTRSYSRDVDASALIVRDTAYLGLENGLFIRFSPDPIDADTLDGILQPEIFSYDTLFTDYDKTKHGGNLVTEASPALLGNRIYIASGSGHVYGYSLEKEKIDWDFFIGSDIDGTPVVTNDSCLLIAVEKQYITGKGGVFKLNPSKDENNCVVWYFPTENYDFAGWKGGVIGSVGINDHYESDSTKNVAVFAAIDGYTYFVKHREIRTDTIVDGPRREYTYKTAVLLHKEYTGQSISTPLVFKDKVIAAGYEGIRLFSYDINGSVEIISHLKLGEIEATPVVYKQKVYVASRTGYLYCLGQKEQLALLKKGTIMNR